MISEGDACGQQESESKAMKMTSSIEMLEAYVKVSLDATAV